MGTLEHDSAVLDILRRNPSQSYSDLILAIRNGNNKLAKIKGENSEVLFQYLVEQVPEVIRVEPFHQFVGKELDLDADFLGYFANCDPIFIQIKYTQKYAEKYRKKISRRRANGDMVRIIAIGTDVPFDNILADFVEQVNNLEGRRVLSPVRFTQIKPRKRKSY